MLSIFLAKLLGLYFLTIGLIALIRKEQFHSVIRSIVSSEGLLALTGMASLLGGLALVIGHPVWELGWRGAITLIGVLGIIRGILRLGFTKELQQKFTRDTLERAHWFMIAFLLIIGGFLTYYGFGY